MTDPEDLPSMDADTACTRCGEQFERGYVTARPSERTAAEFALDESSVVCDSCGWRDVGATGCAPTLDDFDGGALLVRVEREGDGLVPVDVTDEA